MNTKKDQQKIEKRANKRKKTKQIEKTKCKKWQKKKNSAKK